MSLWEVELLWWGQSRTTRRYSAPTEKKAQEYAEQDGHTVLEVRQLILKRGK